MLFLWDIWKKIWAKISSKEDIENNNSTSNKVFELLYYDEKRVASIYTQFSNNGHLTGVIDQQDKSYLKKIAHTGRGSVGLKCIASIHAGVDNNTEFQSQNKSQQQRSYDPFWHNAMAFLNHIISENVPNFELSNAAVGQLVHSQGELNIYDSTILKNLFSIPHAKSLVENGALQVSNFELSGIEKNSIQLEFDFITEILNLFPNLIQATLSNNSNSVWCCLYPEHLTKSSSEIMLNNGHHIPGIWNIIGILDAKPAKVQSDDNWRSLDLTDYEGINVKLLDFMAPLIRKDLGRPVESYGLTPMLIYREIGV